MQVRVLLGLLFILHGTCVRASPLPYPPQRGGDVLPNIVWLVMEDNSVDYLRLYSEDGAPMPRLEALAARGMTFQNAYSQAPVCSVARSTLIAGAYAPRTGTQFHRKAKPVPLPEGLRMFPTYLRRAGYYTANNSKTDYNFIYDQEAWDESSSTADYRDRAPGQPFFYVRNFGTTHEGQLHFPEGDVDSVPTPDAAADMTILPVHPDSEAFRYTRARTHANHRRVDEEIGNVLDRLEADGLMDSTIIFVYGDHGGVLPGSKGYLYETGLHVPLVVYVPEAYAYLSPYFAGSRPEGFARFMDFGPTVLHLAGVEVPKHMDGRPFLGEDVILPDPARDTIYSYADRFDEKADLTRAVRIGDFKYIRSYHPYLPDGLYNEYRYRMYAYRDWLDRYRRGELDSLQSRFFRPRPPEMLFDLRTDPNETDNLADNPAFVAVLASMRGALSQTAVRLPDLSFIPEPVFLAEATANPVAYGQRNAERIKRLIATADLQLLPWEEALPKLREALTADDPLMRYWALIGSSSFGSQALPLVAEIENLRSIEQNYLVRLRIIEFLGIVGERDPRSVLTELLSEATTKAEALAVLNTMSYFRFQNPEWEWALPDVSRFRGETAGGKSTNVERLVGYLEGE